MRSNDVWVPCLAQVGDLMAQLEAAQTLTFHKDKTTHKDLYLSITSCKCRDCGAWTAYLNLLTLQSTCWLCFNRWAHSQLMVKTKVK